MCLHAELVTTGAEAWAPDTTNGFFRTAPKNQGSMETPNAVRPASLALAESQNIQQNDQVSHSMLDFRRLPLSREKFVL